MPHVLRALIVVGLLAGASWSQAAPDLSGSWALDQGASEPAPMPAATQDGPAPPPPPPPPPRQVALTIAQTPSAFRIERTMSSAGSAILQDATYKLDGSETTTNMGPIVSKTTASWNGRELVLSTVHTAAGDTGAMAGQIIGNLQERFTLEDGHLVIESLRRVRGGESTATMVYTRVR